MDYKKKYREAQKWIESIYSELSHEQQMEAEAFFPELKESEDERIRKALICGMYALKEQHKTCFASIPIDNAIAWLEKQGEQKPADRVEPKFKVKYAGSEYNVFETKNIAGVQFYGIEDEPNHIDYVQAENCEIINGGYGIKEGGFSIPTKPAMFSDQKYADKVDDEEYNGDDYGIDSLFHAQRILEKTLGKVDGYQSDDGILEHKCAISAVKKLYEQKPADWSEEDEDLFNDIVRYIRESFSGFVGDRYIKMLKSLKDRVQPKQEWSEEDERKITDVIVALSEYANGNIPNILPSMLLEDVDWLKSLKPQNHWKPAKEQMEALHDLNLTGNISYAGQGQVLIELYNDLKKL